MDIKKFLEILRTPSQLQKEQIFDLEDTVARYPFFQAAKVLYLKGLKNQNSFRYNQNLKTTAIYTADRSVLFHFITSDAFQSVLSNQKEKDIIQEIEVRDEKIIENIYQKTDVEQLEESALNLDVPIPIQKTIGGEQQIYTENSEEPTSSENEQIYEPIEEEVKTTNNKDIKLADELIHEEYLNPNETEEQDSSAIEYSDATKTNQLTDEYQIENDDIKIEITHDLPKQQDEIESKDTEISINEINDVQSKLIEKKVIDFFETRDDNSTEEEESQMDISISEIEQASIDYVDPNTDLSVPISEADTKSKLFDEIEKEPTNFEETIEENEKENPSGYSTETDPATLLIDEVEESTNIEIEAIETHEKDITIESTITNNKLTDEELEEIFAKKNTKNILDSSSDKINILGYTFEKPRKERISLTPETQEEKVFSFEIDTQEEISNIEENNNSSLKHPAKLTNEEPLGSEFTQHDIPENQLSDTLDTAEIHKTEEAKELNKTVEIAIDLDSVNPIHFNKKDTHSFSEWMQLSSFKPIDRSKPPLNKRAEKMALIDEFMMKKPKIKPDKSTSFSVDFNHIEKIESETVMTETLATIYIEQEKYANAINAYEILSLKFPEKSSFFADQIKMLKNKQKNASN